MLIWFRGRDRKKTVTLLRLMMQLICQVWNSEPLLFNVVVCVGNFVGSSYLLLRSQNWTFSVQCILIKIVKFKNFFILEVPVILKRSREASDDCASFKSRLISLVTPITGNSPLQHSRFLYSFFKGHWVECWFFASPEWMSL